MVWRAWDKERSMFFGQGGNLMLDLGGGLYWQFGFQEPTSIYGEEREQYVLEQWTGWLDRDGKRIFEGDILETSNDDTENGTIDTWPPEENGRTTIFWDVDAWNFLGTEWTPDEKGDDSIYEPRFVRIVGNIHQPSSITPLQA